MCLIIFSYQPESNQPLVVAANRDEFFARPTAEAHFWDDTAGSVEILAGRDIQAGGTWLGVDTEGRFAAVTNIRDPSQEANRPRSRGDLTREFLAGRESAASYAASLKDSFGEFAGYNLLLCDKDQMWYVNNFERVSLRLEPGVYGLSNALLDSDWPKINSGKQRLQALLQQAQTSTDDLIAMMDERSTAADSELPATGVSLELERLLSPAFIRNPQRGYGTRCTSALTINRDEPSRFSEQNYSDAGEPQNRHYFEF